MPILIGSLRKDGFSARLANALINAAPQRLSLATVAIGKLPLFNQDDEYAPPEEHVQFRARLERSQAVLIVTPEYNRSIPGALKNALDIASRPYGQSVLAGKPVAIASQSPGAMGGMAANHALRLAAMSMGMPVMPQPEVYLANAERSFAADGTLSEAAPAALLTDFMEAFAVWASRFVAAD
ncbi:NAD(P)H-dependent oxidoreductase [Sphingomonas sp. H160509]|uniref:NADPH-dependent FMN reductase n=1 Tax=Sphingomonas sp. H160509 TaxID=2955313 RepID=UPI0021E74721|nr:NAD(P)H-dependent oxidoreductase [Sphingomonas sp. H160509]